MARVFNVTMQDIDIPLVYFFLGKAQAAMGPDAPADSNAFVQKAFEDGLVAGWRNAFAAEAAAGVQAALSTAPTSVKAATLEALAALQGMDESEQIAALNRVKDAMPQAKRKSKEKPS